MSERDTGFRGEDANAGLASPIMDLVAAAALALIALWTMVEAWRLPVPGSIATAPGLLPFLTAASLFSMALVLGSTALARRRTLPPGGDRFELPSDFRRTLALGVIVIVYAAGLQFVPVEAAYTVFGVRLVVGAFEVVSIVVLTAILRLYWQAPLWTCALTALAWVAFLSISFRSVFHIQLP